MIHRKRKGTRLSPPPPFFPSALRSQPHLTDAQLLVKRVRGRFSTEEILEGAHLVLAASSLEDGVAVASALGRVHRVGGEDGVEHVGRVDLGAVARGEEKRTQGERLRKKCGGGREGLFYLR